MRFYFDNRTDWNASDNFATIEKAIGFCNNPTHHDFRFNEQSIQIPDQYNLAFLEFTSRLQETAEYKNIQIQKTLGSRIITVISKMHEFKREALDYMHTANSSCHDRIIKGLDDIEQRGS